MKLWWYILAGALLLSALVKILINTNHFDQSGYNKALLDENYKGRLGHFPDFSNKKIRPLGYSHEYPFLQGGGHLQLLCFESDYDYVWSKNKNMFVYTSPGIDNYFINNSKHPENTLPLVSLLIDGKRIELGKDWMIGVLYAERNQNESDPDIWNHGRTGGIAINREKSLVLYWCENW